MGIGYHKFGSMTSQAGSLYYSKDNESIIQVFADIYKSALLAKGINITSDIEQQILTLLREQKDEFERKVNEEGIPEKVKGIFDYTKKSKVVSYCNKITISEDELFLLVHNCSQMGFTCRSKFKEFVPQNLKIEDSDVYELKLGNSRNLIKKVKSIFDQRKRNNIHLFEREKEWHCFYYNYRDIESGEKTHSRYGSHLHYVSYLWPNLGQNSVWGSFDKRNVDFQGIHIKMAPHSQPVEEFTLNIKYSNGTVYL